MNFEIIRTGFGLAESPRADARNVWFTDMALGGVHHLQADGRAEHLLAQRPMIGGLALNEDGALLCSGSGGIIWFDPATGAQGTLLDTIDGVPISGVNDMAPDGQGGLLFGTVDHARMFRGESFFGHSAIYQLSVDRKLSLLCSGIGFANGLGLSPDARWVYVNNSGIGTFAHERRPDSSLAPGNQLCGRADCDGLAVDCLGGVWVACISSSVIVRLTPDGRVDREIPVEGGAVTSLCFGGPDGRDLYVTTAAAGAGAAVVRGALPEACTGSLLRGRADVSGLPMQRTRFRLRVPTRPA